MRRQIDYLYPMLSHPLQNMANEHDIEIRVTAHYLDFIKREPNRIVRLSTQHWTYINDIILSFDYYFDAVEPLDWSGYQLVDYSLPKFHNVIGFDLMPVMFASFSEPMASTLQYLDFAALQPGSVVFDLGAYSGLSSIVFKEQVGASGRVVAVDADTQNTKTIETNLALYKSLTKQDIELVYGAMWHHCDGLEFSSDGTMGASATGIVGGRGTQTMVKSYTLSKLADLFDLKAIDFIKCDIEGAESVIFEDADFFKQFRPKIIVEPHMVAGTMTTAQCVDALSRYGYTCEIIEQPGVVFPLIACSP
jgi:FkbM family methyltransferase